MDYKRRICRSREGAWIEIDIRLGIEPHKWCRSREGAWIEIAAEDAFIGVGILSLPRGSVD